MGKAVGKIREEARRLFLTGESSSNSEIARHLGLKPHTVGRWRKDEGWDDLRLKVDRRAAEKLVEQIATDRVSLNVRHFNFYEVVLNEITATLKAGHGKFTAKDLVDLVGIIEKAQKGQRLARGLSLDGQTEEEARAEAQAENRALVDIFIDAVKESVPDPATRDRLREAILTKLPVPEADLDDDAA